MTYKKYILTQWTWGIGWWLLNGRHWRDATSHGRWWVSFDSWWWTVGWASCFTQSLQRCWTSCYGLSSINWVIWLLFDCFRIDSLWWLDAVRNILWTLSRFDDNATRLVYWGLPIVVVVWRAHIGASSIDWRLSVWPRIARREIQRLFFGV